MAGPQLSFRGTSVINPYESLINVLGKNGALAQNMMANDEAKRLEQEQAYKNELLSMQKAEHQMKVDEQKQRLLEKDQANKYASVLGAATSGNVVGVDDQAKLAAIAQDTRLTPEQQAAKIQSVLPAMTKAYEKSPEEQLKVVRASNPLGGLADINPATRIALLKEAEAPMEKAVDRAQAVEDRREDAKTAFENQKKLIQMREAISEAAENRKRALDPMFNPGTGTHATRGEIIGSPLISSADQTVVGTKIAELGKQAEDAGKLGDKAKQAALLTQQQDYISKVLPKMRSDYKNGFIPLEDWTKIAALNTKTKTEYDIFEDPQGDQHYVQKGSDVPKGWDKVGAGSGGTGSGGSKGKKGEDMSTLSKTRSVFRKQADLIGTGDARAGDATIDLAVAAGIPTSTINDRLQAAVDLGDGLLTDTKFTPENFRNLDVITADGKTASLADMLSAMAELGVKPIQTDKGLKLDVDYKDLVKTKAYAAQNEVVIDDPYMQTAITNKPAVVLPKEPTKGLDMGPTLQDKALNELITAMKNATSGQSIDYKTGNDSNTRRKVREIYDSMDDVTFQRLFPREYERYIVNR